MSLKKYFEDKNTPYGLIVSIGNGILEKDGKFMDVGIVMTIDDQGRTSIAMSEGVIFPDHYVEEARKIGFDKITVGRVIAQHLTDDPALQDKLAIDPQSSLTGGERPRQQLLKEAILRALQQIFWY